MVLGNVPKPVFISYAHEDNESPDRAERWLDRLKQQLVPLVRHNITICSDQDIGLGEDWHAHIQAHLNSARAAVLLVSPAFLASEYVYSSELPVLLRNAAERGVEIIPVILRPCLFEETRFKYPDPKSGPEEFTLASLQAAGSPTRTLSEMSRAEQDRALLKVGRALAKVLEPNLRAGSSQAAPSAASRTPRAVFAKAPQLAGVRDALELSQAPQPASTTYHATLTGSGSIAQGPDATAVGAGGVYVGGKNTGSINTGTQIDTGACKGDNAKTPLPVPLTRSTRPQESNKEKPMLLTRIPEPDARRGLQKIAGCDNPKRALDIVFIHGLGGDSWTTWMTDDDDVTPSGPTGSLRIRPGSACGRSATRQAGRSGGKSPCACRPRQSGARPAQQRRARRSAAWLHHAQYGRNRRQADSAQRGELRRRAVRDDRSADRGDRFHRHSAFRRTPRELRPTRGHRLSNERARLGAGCP